MDRDIAEHIQNITEDFFTKLDNSIRLVMERSPDEEFQRYRRAAGKVLGYTYMDIQCPIYEEHPDLTPPGLRKE
jgi:hypothetical protein